MAQIIWTGPATRDVQEIAEFIAFDNPEAAANVVSRIEKRVGQLKRFPQLGPLVSEQPVTLVRQLVEPPSRIFYRIDGTTVYILHVLRFEKMLRISRLEDEED